MLTNNKFFGNKNIGYNVYKIIPDINIENNQNEVIARAISTLYKTPLENFKLDIKGMQITYKSKRRIMFDILLVPNNAYFYFTLPIESEELFLNKIKSIWNNAAIIKIKDDELSRLNDFNSNSTVVNLILKTFNFKGINVAKDNLYPLSNMIGLVSELKADSGERVRLNFDVEPIKRSNWINKANDEYNSYKKGKIVDNEKTIKENIAKGIFKTFEYGINMYIEFRLMIFESLLGIIVPKEKENEKLELILNSVASTQEENKYIGLSNSTTHKMTSETFSTGITIISKSTDTNRRDINLLTVANSYKDLNNDNELVIKRLNSNEQKKAIRNVITNKQIDNRSVYSDKEIAKFIQLPQKTLQQLYKLDNIDNREITVPIELQGGNVRIGIAENKGDKVTATFSTDKNVMALAKVFVGPQNCGKTTAIKRTVKDCYKAGYSNIVIDFIENCEVAREVAEIIPSKDKVIIELGKKDMIPSLAYNEVSRLIKEDMDPWERIRLANLLSEQVEYLINAITDVGTGELTAPMIRYLHAASMITFIKPNAKINDIFDILRRWDKRNEAIRYAKNSGCFDLDDDIFFDLEELHKRDKEGKIIGTREDTIIGITNRITILKKNPHLKAMLQADIDNKQDFTKYIEEGKNVFIMIPQNIFPNPVIRDILTTFFITRVWLTVQMRENNKEARLCNVIFDEVHQVPTTAKFLSNHVTEFRRHRLGLILSCHYLKQFKELLVALKSSGASYVLIGGTEKENFESLKQELDPFTIEDGLNLKPYTSLNIINYGNQYAKFITTLPKH